MSAPAQAAYAEPAAAPPAPAEPAPPAPALANPMAVGLPVFLVGSIALALNLGNYVSQGAVGSPIAIIMFGTGLGLLVATVYALQAGQSAVAAVFGIFAGFWLSYGALVFGLLHNWFGLAGATPAATVSNTLGTVKMFALAWLIVVAVLTLASVRLPVAYPLLFLFVALALLFVLLAYVNASAAGVPSSGDLKVAAVFVWVFVVIGVYLFVDTMWQSTGGPAFPLGPALVS